MFRQLSNLIVTSASDGHVQLKTVLPRSCVVSSNECPYVMQACKVACIIIIMSVIWHLMLYVWCHALAIPYQLLLVMLLISGESVDSAASLRDLTANLFELQKSGYLCDTVLVADDGQLKAHSVVLAAASPVFKQVLKSSDQPLQHTILLPGMQLVVVSIIIQFIYTGKMMTTNDECGYSVKVMDAINDLGIKVHVSRYFFQFRTVYLATL